MLVILLSSWSIPKSSHFIIVFIACLDSFFCVIIVNISPNRCVANLPIPFFPAFFLLKIVVIGLCILSDDDIRIKPFTSSLKFIPHPSSSIIRVPPGRKAFLKTKLTYVASASYAFLISSDIAVSPFPTNSFPKRVIIPASTEKWMFFLSICANSFESVRICE